MPNIVKGKLGCDRLCTHHKAACWHKSLLILIVQGRIVSLVVGRFMFVLRSDVVCDVPCAEDTWTHCPKVWPCLDMSITVLY